MELPARYVVVTVLAFASLQAHAGAQEDLRRSGSTSHSRGRGRRRGWPTRPTRPGTIHGPARSTVRPPKRVMRPPRWRSGPCCGWASAARWRSARRRSGTARLRRPVTREPRRSWGSSMNTGKASPPIGARRRAGACARRSRLSVSDSIVPVASSSSASGYRRIARVPLRCSAARTARQMVPNCTPSSSTGAMAGTSTSAIRAPACTSRSTAAAAGSR